MSLSEVIREARDALKLSQADVAEQLKVSTGTVAGWELGDFRPRFKKLRAIAKVLRLSHADLIALAVKAAS